MKDVVSVKQRFILKEGGTLGDLYTHADLKRDINGNVLIDDDGNVTAVDNAGDIKLGSVLPKANLAWNNSFTYKGIQCRILGYCPFGRHCLLRYPSLS